jgi:hypothetical protein
MTYRNENSHFDVHFYISFQRCRMRQLNWKWYDQPGVRCRYDQMKYQLAGQFYENLGREIRSSSLL